ncbi:hypothetical protein C2G38_2171245 [Gigaspora rosea]|uniref:DEAD-box RNA helicase Q domain-containing protein n=1 Tax=Gigaspora rosea TaxID=44941 RepID=A0A397VNU7_9GLOM|nr:hypothetical protein C2G38_2171245 [Gigaspora rosea]
MSKYGDTFGLEDDDDYVPYVPIKQRREAKFQKLIETTSLYPWSPQREHDAIRQMYHILVDGEEIPQQIKHFRDMKFPPEILKYLKSKGINRPTPIQVQGLLVVVWKNLAFSLPLTIFALEEEVKLPLIRGEGPIGMIVCPSNH